MPADNLKFIEQALIQADIDRGLATPPTEPDIKHLPSPRFMEDYPVLRDEPPRFMEDY